MTRNQPALYTEYRPSFEDREPERTELVEIGVERFVLANDRSHHRRDRQDRQQEMAKRIELKSSKRARAMPLCIRDLGERMDASVAGRGGAGARSRGRWTIVPEGKSPPPGAARRRARRRQGWQEDQRRPVA